MVLVSGGSTIVSGEQSDGTPTVILVDSAGRQVVVGDHTNAETSDKELITSSIGHVCTENSTTTNLGIDEVFAGEWQDTLEYGVVVVGIKSNKDSATDGLMIEWSADGTNKAQDDVFTISADAGKVFTFGPANRYVRIKYTNGGVATTSLNIQTILRRVYVKPSSHRINDAIVAEDDAQLIKAVLTGENAGGTFVNFQATNAGNFKVSLEELESGVSSNSNSQLNTSLFDIDGTDANVVTNTDDDTNLDGVNGLVAASIAYARIDGDKIKPLRMDASTHSIQTLTYEHHEIHSGSSFVAVDLRNVDNTTFKWQVTTPAGTKYTHIVFDLDCTGEMLALITEGSDRVDGTALVELNRNRVGTPNVAGTIVTHTPTGGTTDGTVVLMNHRSGATGVGSRTIASGGARGGNEFVLKPATKYVISVTTYANVWVSLDLDWYEHTDKD